MARGGATPVTRHSLRSVVFFVGRLGTLAVLVLLAMGQVFADSGPALPAAIAQTTVAADSVSRTTDRAGPPAPGNYGQVGFATISGPIDRLRHRYLERVVGLARQHKLDTVIVHIDTDGGTVLDAREMFKLVLDQDRGGPRMIALVDFRAISAGAMIAYAHEAIYVSETASIGDIGIIFKGADGEMKYAPEKIETVVRTLLTQAAELRGWNRGILLKMTAHKQKLYRVTFADGTMEYVIEDDFPAMLARHPEVDKDDPKQVIVYRGEDRLITLTGREAVQMGMATALVADKDALYAKLGIDPTKVMSLSPSGGERTAWAVAPFTPLLAGLAFLFLLFEFKTPGIGIWAALATACGALFLLAHFYLDLVENVEVLLLVGGALLVGLELLTGIGAGLLGLLGAAAALSGLVMAFIPNDIEFDFSDPRFVDALTGAGFDAVISLAVVLLGTLAFIVWVPHSRGGRRLGLQAEITADSTGSLKASESRLVGRLGTASEVLRPSGTVILDGQSYGARVQHSGFVTDGCPVEVVAVEFGELVVRAIPAGQAEHV